MNQLGTTLLAFSVTVAGVAVVAQPRDPPPTSSASRKQSGTVGPPIDAASAQTSDMGASAAPSSVIAPPVVRSSGDDADTTGTTRPKAYTRKASGRVTPASEPSDGPAIRADRN